MREKKLQVFVSSTFTDLKQERQAAVEAILSSGNIPAGMELFSAGDESQMTIIERWIDESDVYMLILGGRYGSIEPKSGKSYTQLEYEYALEKNKPLFAVVLSEKAIDEKVKVDGKSVLENENNHLLKEFKELVTSKMVEFCDDKKDIQLAIFKTLSDFSYSKDLIGWIKGDNAVNSNLLAEEIARLTKENDELRSLNLNNNEVHYNGLKYHELKNILLKIKLDKKYDPDDYDYDDLFTYILKNGQKYTNYSVYYESFETTELLKLNLVKVIREKSDSGRAFLNLSTYYLFTEDGHKFYLRTLLDEEN